MSIALKEAYEAEYWIQLLYKTDYLNKREFESLFAEVDELVNLLVSICKSSKLNR